MKITNKTGLPQPIVDAIKADTYSRGEADISVTQLIDPPQKVWIEEQHADEIVEDAADCLYRLDGKTVHEILQKASGIMPAEKRLFAKCGGWTISGGMDRIALMEKSFGVEVQDWKRTSLYTFKDGLKQEWVNQLNCYAWLLRENGYDPQKLTIVVMCRDWSKLEAKRKPDYPQSQVMVIDVPMWSREDAEAWVTLRVKRHQAHRKNGSLPTQCTSEERWERPTKYAVMKEGRKSALRVLESRDDAFHWMTSKGLSISETTAQKIWIEERPGEAVRCESYCNAAPWCPQYQQEKADGPD